MQGGPAPEVALRHASGAAALLSDRRDEWRWSVALVDAERSAHTSLPGTGEAGYVRALVGPEPGWLPDRRILPHTTGP